MRQSKRLPGNISRILRTTEELSGVFRAVAPNASKKTISWIASGLASLEEVSLEHLQILHKIKKLSRRQDSEKLLHQLAVVQSYWFSTASYNITELQSFLPKLVKHIHSKRAKRAKIGPRLKLGKSRR
jgi:hypothetical protein